MEATTVGCAAPGDGAARDVTDTGPAMPVPDVKENRMSVMVGTKAPDFEANGFQNGTFGKFKLADNEGKWVVLCFYPGDFTFV